MRSEHLQTKEKPGRKPFREIKVMKEDAASVERMSEEIKARYTVWIKQSDMEVRQRQSFGLEVPTGEETGS
jgi:hypothetical protein